MVSLYYPPFKAADDSEMTATAALALRDYVEDLAEFPVNVLREAWKDARRPHKTRDWPALAAIRNAALEKMPRAAAIGGRAVQIHGPDHQLYQARMRGYAPGGFWPYGEPRPEHPDNRVPRHLNPFHPVKVVARPVIPDDAA